MKQNVVVKEQKFKDSKITQKQMAQYLGCSESTKSDIELTQIGEPVLRKWSDMKK